MSNEKRSSSFKEDVQVSAERPSDEAQVAHDPSFSGINEAKLWRKLDLHLIPMLTVLYLLSFLDRGNIGNARIEGLVEDLGMSSAQYNWTLTVFFFTYSAFELPSNLILKKLRPSIWLPAIMFAWGTVMTLMGIVQNYHGLLVARLMLGVAEAGLYPGVAYYITMWYPRHLAQFRQAMFFSAASVAGAFSGLLAFGIAKMDGVGGLEGWRWIFILEGILTVVVAVVAPFAIYDFPDTAKFLTDEERRFVIHTLNVSKARTVDINEPEKFQMRDVTDALKDWQIYPALIMYWGIVCPLYGISLFLPSIIRDLGYTNSTAQLLTVPIYCTAAVVAIVAARFSDRHGQRSPFILFFMSLIALGFIIVLASSGRNVPGVVYFGVFVAVVGIYPAFPGNVTWLSCNLAGGYKRAAGMAIHIGVGNLAGAMASNFYRGEDAPRYILGHSLELGFCLAGIIAATTLRLIYSSANRRREVLRQNQVVPTEKQRGDKSPYFVYML